MKQTSFEEFVHNAIFLRHVRKIDDIYRQARKNGFGNSRREVQQAVEDVCTPYKQAK